MLDPKMLRTETSYVQKALAKKGYIRDADQWMRVDSQMRDIQQTIESYNAERNVLTDRIQQAKKAGEPMEPRIKQVQDIKKEIAKLQEQYTQLRVEREQLTLALPNIPLEDVPVGETEEDNVVLERWGEVETKKSFTAKEHRELLQDKSMLDQEASAEVSGSRFYYTRGDLVLLEQALQLYALHKLQDKGFTPVIGPNLVKYEAMQATGFFPAEHREVYRVNPDEDDLYLIGTSEVSMVAQHMGITFTQEQLPRRYVSISPCYRREAGSYGKDTKGLIRVHQFQKVEMVSFVRPEDSERELEMILAIEEQIYQELKIPYRKVAMCTADLGGHAARKYDLEAWMPGLQQYKEITSCSNCTDYQARRAQIKYKNDQDKNEFVHTLNGTAISLTRFLAVFVENHQQEDGSIAIPEVLQPYIQGKTHI